MTFEIGKNSYMSIDEANDIVNSIYFDEDEEYIIWKALKDEDKEKLIIKTTRIIDKLLFLGNFVNLYGMSWPRYINGRLVDCPDDVKIAIVVQSISDRIENKSKEANLIKKGVKSYSIKDASITFSDNASIKSKVYGAINQEVYMNYLSKWTY